MTRTTGALLGIALLGLVGCAATPEPQLATEPAKCPGTPQGVPIDHEGCPLDSDQDGIPDFLDQCPYTPPGLAVNSIGCSTHNIVLHDVNFKFDSAELTASAKAALDRMASDLLKQSNSRVLLEGHTDSIGTEDYNLNLSQRRVDSVKAYLVAAGFPAQNIRAIGYGESRPVASNETPEGRALNRRVELGEWNQ